MHSLILMPAMALVMAGGAIALKFFVNTENIYLFAVSLSLYMGGTAMMAELMRGGLSLTTTILMASILQLVIVQFVAVFAFGEAFHLAPFLVSILAVFLLITSERSA